MSFQRQADGTMLGCGPDADYPGRAAAEAHWRRVRGELAAGTYQEPDRPQSSVADAALKQIALLKRDLMEWRGILARALHNEINEAISK